MWESNKSFWSLGSEKARELCRRLAEAGLDIACMRNRMPIPGKKWDWDLANQILEDVIAGRETVRQPKPKKVPKKKKTEEPKKETKKKATTGRKRKPRGKKK